MSPPPRPSSLLLALIGVVLVVASGGGLWRIVSGSEALAWPSVEGEVIHSGTDARTPRSEQSLWRQRPSGAYRPVVRYRYAVEGTPYLSDRVGTGEPARGPREIAEAEADRYPLGARVRVYYDPAAPGTAMLEPRSRPSPWQFTVGALGLLAGLGCLGASLRSTAARGLW